MRLRVEEKIRLGYIPKKQQRYCKECGIEVGKRKSYCSPCLYERHNPIIKRTCKTCGVEVGKWKSYCSNCKTERNKTSIKKTIINNRKYKICGFEGCKKPREKWIHSCEYHSSKNRDIRFMEEKIRCKDCDGVIGKRKDWKINRWKICDDCIEIRKKNTRKKQIKYYGKWFKKKYHTDEGFRKRHLKYQKDYKIKRNEETKSKIKQN